MNNKILTISIAAYNAQDYLRKCLDSFIDTNVLEQLDIIIVNDGSSDYTMDIGNEYFSKYPNSIAVINKENGGHGSTINTSISIARGKYFKIVDADDWVDKAGIEKLVCFLEKSNVDMVVNPFFEVQADTGKSKLKTGLYEERDIFGEDYELDEIIDNLQLLMHGITFKTDILQNNNIKVDEKCFYVDNEYVLYPLPYIKSITVLDYPIYMYLVGTEHQSVNIGNMIKKRKQHFRVIQSIVAFMNKCEIGDNVRNAIARKVEGLIWLQYVLLWSTNPVETKTEYMALDNLVKNEMTALPIEFSKKQKILIYFDRYTRYSLHIVILKLLQNIGKFGYDSRL